MKFLNAIEEKINAFLVKIFELMKIWFGRLWQKIIPIKVIQKYDLIKNYFRLKQEAFQKKKIEIYAKIMAFLKTLKDKKEKILNIKSHIIVHVSAFFEEIRHPKKDGPKFKENLRKYLLLLDEIWKKVIVWIEQARPSVIVASIVSFCFIGLAVIVILKSTNQIMVKSGVNRTPASEEIELKGRPNYYKAEKRFMVMMNIYVPVYAEDTNKYQTLSVDIQIVTSIRFTKEFLTKNQTLVRDKLSMTLEPIIPEFALTVEGRAVLKDKIKTEIENLLHEQEIPGHIVDIVIVNIFTS